MSVSCGTSSKRAGLISGLRSSESASMGRHRVYQSSPRGIRTGAARCARAARRTGTLVGALRATPARGGGNGMDRITRRLPTLETWMGGASEADADPPKQMMRKQLGLVLLLPLPASVQFAWGSGWLGIVVWQAS